MLRSNNEDSGYTWVARAASGKLRSGGVDEDGFRAFSFSIKDIIVFGTVLVSVVSAWGMINTRITLTESSVTSIKEEHRKYVESQEEALRKLEGEIDVLRGEMSFLKEHSRDIEASMRRYAYTLRRVQKDVESLQKDTP